MTKYHRGGGSPEDFSSPNLFLAVFLGGYPDDYEFGYIEQGGYITKQDPYIRLYGSGDKQVDLGLWDDYRIKISASGIHGWNENASAWSDLLT